MNRFNKLLINVPILSFSPVLFVVSCGENVASDSNYQKEITNKFKNSFIEFPNLITTKNKDKNDKARTRRLYRTNHQKGR